jgi:hypothetical protein
VQSPFFLCFYEQLKNNLWLFFFIPLVAKENTKGTFVNIYMFFSFSVYLKDVFLEQKNRQRRIEDT